MLDKGTVVIGGIIDDDVEQAVELVKAMQENHEPTILAPDYTDANVSVKVVKIIQSYAKIVNDVVWRKNE